MHIYQLSDPELWDKINSNFQAKGGVYKLIAIKKNVPVMIGRFLNVDQNGVLYIGKAESFIDRVIQLKKSILSTYKGSGHICGRRYKSTPSIAQKFPDDILYVELEFAHNPSELEKQYLMQYFEKYGEVPPLNAY